MSKIIKKIAMDCDVYCDQHYPGSSQYDILWEQKFAELIVKECAAIFKNNWTMAGSEPPISAVKKHFGVEE